MNDPADDMPLAVFAIAYEDTTAATIFDKSETAAIHVTPIWHPEMDDETRMAKIAAWLI